MVAYSPEAHPPSLPQEEWGRGREATTICHMSNRFKGTSARGGLFSEGGRGRGRGGWSFQKIKWCKWAVNDRDQRRMKNGEWRRERELNCHFRLRGNYLLTSQTEQKINIKIFEHVKDIRNADLSQSPNLPVQILKLFKLRSGWYGITPSRALNVQLCDHSTLISD